MKIRVTLKAPDGFHEAVLEAVQARLGQIRDLSEDERERLVESRCDSVWKKLSAFVRDREYVTLAFDLDAGTAEVVRGRDG